MMIRTIAAPLLGGIIGYITNDLAIRMLFRPRKAMYIGKLHIPFTPGLIPSQKSRIAASIGNVISSQLLNEETLRQTILSDETIDTLRERIMGWLHDNIAVEERTIGELVSQYSPDGRIASRVDEFETQAANYISLMILQADAGVLIVDAIMQYLQGNASIGWLTKRLMDNSTKQKISEKVNEMIALKTPGIIRQVLDKTIDDYKNTRACDFYQSLNGREQKLVDKLLELYKTLLGNNLGKLLQAVNIERIVVDKINSFDAAQLEAMIFGIMKRELRAIVYLGAALGFLMGFINLIL